MTSSPGEQPRSPFDFAGVLKALRYIAMSHLDENARVSLEPRGTGMVCRVEWNQRSAEYEWDLHLYDLPHPQIAIEGRVQVMCAELARTRISGPESVTMKAVEPAVERPLQHAAARVGPTRLSESTKLPARFPESRPSRNDISRIEASVRRVLTDSITSGSVVRIVVRADPTSGLPVRVLDGIPRGFKPATDGRLRVVLEIVGGETEQLILLERISMVSQAPI